MLDNETVIEMTAALWTATREYSGDDLADQFVAVFSRHAGAESLHDLMGHDPDLDRAIEEELADSNAGAGNDDDEQLYDDE